MILILSYNVIIVPDPQSVTVAALSGSDVIISCTIELGPAVMQSELSLLMVDAQLSRDGTPLAMTNPTVSGTSFIYTTQLNSFGSNDSEKYTCTATIRPQPTSTYLTGMATMSDTARIITGN